MTVIFEYTVYSQGSIIASFPIVQASPVVLEVSTVSNHQRPYHKRAVARGGPATPAFHCPLPVYNLVHTSFLNTMGIAKVPE
jgi:hypothetical protein